MDVATAEIRYQRWVQVIQDWRNSGLSKRDYCEQHEIDEKQFYSYQRRIRAVIAAQAGGKRCRKAVLDWQQILWAAE